ncbi:MAG: hypothetical protein ACRC0S_00065 [Fusobacteriaceae bacterium]
MKLIKKIILITLLLCGSLNVYGIKMSPISFDKRIDINDSFREIMFENVSSKTVRYKIAVHSPDKDLKDMSKWVTLSPKILTIPAYSKRPLKIFAKSPSGTAAGEYAFTLVVDTVVIPTIAKTEEGKVQGSSTVSFTPIIGMYGYVGDAKFNENFNIENMNLDKAKMKLTGKLVNKSYIGKELAISYIGKNNASIGGERLGRVTAGYNKSFSINVSKEIVDNLKKVRVYDIKELEEVKVIEIL